MTDFDDMIRNEYFEDLEEEQTIDPELKELHSLSSEEVQELYFD
jgi:hypothetical protein